MKPQDLIRAAAKIISEQGWCSGVNNQGHVVHVRDQSGIALPLYRGDNSGQDKAKVNPGARAFSIYGALCKAMDEARGEVADPGAMWDVLYRLGAVESGARIGGLNYVHPVIQLNEKEGQTKEGVLAFLERVATEIEAPETLPPGFVPKTLLTREQLAETYPPAEIIPITTEAAKLMFGPTENTSDLVAMQGDEDLFEPEPLRHTHEPLVSGITGTTASDGFPPSAPIKAPVPQIKADPAVEETKTRLPPIGWGEA